MEDMTTIQITSGELLIYQILEKTGSLKYLPAEHTYHHHFLKQI